MAKKCSKSGIIKTRGGCWKAREKYDEAAFAHEWFWRMLLRENNQAWNKAKLWKTTEFKACKRKKRRKRKVFLYVPFRLGCEYCTNPSDTYRVLLIVDARLHRVSVGCLVYSSSVSSSAYIDGTFRSGLYDAIIVIFIQWFLCATRDKRIKKTTTVSFIISIRRHRRHFTNWNH